MRVLQVLFKSLNVMMVGLAPYHEQAWHRFNSSYITRIADINEHLIQQRDPLSGLHKWSPGEALYELSMILDEELNMHKMPSDSNLNIQRVLYDDFLVYLRSDFISWLKSNIHSKGETEQRDNPICYFKDPYILTCWARCVYDHPVNAWNHI